MFGPLGVPELLMIFAVVLIVFGPRRIPEIGRTLGKALAEFRKATDDLKGTIEREVRLEELKKITPQVIQPFDVVSRSEPDESWSERVDESAGDRAAEISSTHTDEPDDAEALLDRSNARPPAPSALDDSK